MPAEMSVFFVAIDHLHQWTHIALVTQCSVLSAQWQRQLLPGGPGGPREDELFHMQIKRKRWPSVCD